MPFFGSDSKAELLRARALVKKAEFEKKLKEKQPLFAAASIFTHGLEGSSKSKNPEEQMLEQHIAALQGFLDGRVMLNCKKSLLEQERNLSEAEEGLRLKRERVRKVICEIDLVNALLSTTEEHV